MKNIKLLLILLMNCALMLPIMSDVPILCTKDPCYTRLFFYDSNNFAYTHEPHEETLTKELKFIKLNHGVSVQTLDYHSKKNLLFWIKPQNKFNENAKLYSMEWNYREACLIDNYYNIQGLNAFGCNSPIHEYWSENVQILREEDWNPRSIAVDYVTDKLYIVNTGESSVNVYDLEGNNKTIVFENESLIPLEVVLDASEGLMFVLAVKRKTGILQIYRINMDGSEPQLLIDNADVMEKFYQNARFGFALDISKKRIYFGNFEKELIETVNYFGNERLMVTNIKSPQSISIYNNTLYSMSPVSCNRINKCYYLTCKLNNAGSCIENTKEIIPCPENIKTEAIKAINSNSISLIKNPCGDNRGGCQHHCLLKSSNTSNQKLDYSCVCNNGYKLEPNRKNCTYSKIFSAYDQVYVSEKKDFVDSWDSFSTEDIFPISKTLLIRLINNNKAVYDWITKNIYSLKWNENNDNLGKDYDLMLEKDKVNRNDKEEPNVSISLAKIEEPIFMTIHPYRGYLFIILKSNGSVLRVNTDGSDQTLLPNVNNSITLAIDFNEDRLYWLDKNRTAWYSDLDGRNTKQLFKSVTDDFDFMYVYDNYLYAKNGNNKNIWRYNKMKGKAIGIFKISSNNFYRETVGMKVSAKDVQLVNATDHPCAINNGGCERFCFGVPETKNGSLKRVCACSDKDLHLYGTQCRVPNKNLRLLFYGKHNVKYAIGYSPQLYEPHGPNNLIHFMSNKNIEMHAIDYHPGKNTLFWISPRYGLWERIPKLFSAKLDDNFFGDETNVIKNPDIELLREEKNWNPRSLAVDYVGNKLYIVDVTTKSIIVLNLDGNNKTTIFKNENLIPIEVKVDPLSGLMFILVINVKNKVSQIYRLNMDGTEENLIVSAISSVKIMLTYERTAFTIDTNRRRVYFANDGNNKIESRSYEGVPIPIVEPADSYSSWDNQLYVAKTHNPYNLHIYKDTLYWVENHCYGTGCYSLYKSCKLNYYYGLCIKDSIKLIYPTKSKDFIHEAENFYGIKPIDRYEHSNISNPCENNNGGCQHHCLRKQSTYSCACNQGYRLKDSYACVEDEVYYLPDVMYIPVSGTYKVPMDVVVRIIYSTVNTVYYEKPFRFFQVSNSNDAILDINLAPEDQNPNPLEINLLDSDVLSYNNSFYTIKVKTSYNESLAETVTYDWITKTVYYVTLFNNSMIGNLKALKYDKSVLPEFFNDPIRFEYGETISLDLAKIYSPKFMVVHPYCGYIFVSLNDNSTIRLNSDGSNITVLSNVTNAEVLAIDYNEDQLYWIHSEKYIIKRANLDGSNQKEVFNTDWSTANFTRMFMYIYEEYIFIRLEVTSNIIIIHKNKKNIVEDFNIGIKNLYYDNILMDAPIKETYRREIDHPCMVENGDCEKFCFGVSKNNQSQLEKVCA